MEKIALSAVAIFFISLAIWGYSFLRKKNQLANDEPTLEFPIKGEHTSISGFTTFWKNPKDISGVKIGAQVIPAATITLSEGDNNSGALRIYFRNADEESVGDPITIAFNNGQFSNGEKSIEVNASDGFHLEGDFNAYVLDRDLSWRAQVLEAANANAAGSEFKEILETIVEPIRK